MHTHQSFSPPQYVLNLKGMGDGSFEAANYLNALPNARDLKVWSDKGAVCAVFVGECYTGYNAKELKRVDFNYYVVSADRASKFEERLNFKRAYETNNYAYKLVLGGRENNFIKVVDTKNIKK